MKITRIVFILFVLVLALTSVAFAQATGAGEMAAPPSFGEIFQRMIPMFVIVFFIFYFMVMKPQQAKLKAQQTLIDSLKKGEQVVTTSGIIGRVAGTEKGYILLEVAQNVKIRIESAHVTRRYDESVQAGAGDKVKSSDKLSTAN